jgi:WD40 repeat protein
MIYTFYSFKGGVGRSMALANVGEWFRSQGLRVVMLDWDLEAPGLESFFFTEKEKLQEIQSKLGLIDLLLAYKSVFPNLPLLAGKPDAEKMNILQDYLPPISHALYPIPASALTTTIDGSALWLLPAGWREGGQFTAYSQVVQSFDWADFYARFMGDVYFDWLRTTLLSDELADIVLIDSRTGVTEMGGVCTRQLADVVVAFCAPNDQNLNGVARMVESFMNDAVLMARKNRPLKVLVLPTRIDDRVETDLVNKFRDDFCDTLKRIRLDPDVSWELKIPYVSKYAFKEKLVINAPDKAEALDKAYNALSEHLAGYLADSYLGGSTLPTRFSPTLRKVFDKRQMHVPFMAPTLPAELVERQTEFNQLLDHFLDKNRVIPIAATVALRGAGGTGKTMIAVALSHNRRIRAAFKDGILWATLGNKPNVVDRIKKVCAALTVQRPGASTDQRLEFSDAEEAALYLSSALQGKDCLLVIDDVWQPSDLVPFLRGGERCARLIITRNSNVVDAAKAKKVEVGELPLAEAIEMLIVKLPAKPEDLSPFSKLAQRLGNWPLALELAGARLRRSVSTEPDTAGALSFINQLLDERGIVAFDQPYTVERHQSVAATILDNMTLLDATPRRCYTELAIFPKDVDIPLKTVSALWGKSEVETQDLALVMADYSLLHFNRQSGTVRLPEVVRSFLAAGTQEQFNLHARLIAGWGDLRNLQDDYAWRWIGYHLAQAGDPEQAQRLRRLLLDFNWLQSKLNATDATALVADYTALADDESLRLVQDCLTLSAHIINQDKQQLAGQLLGRLQSFTLPDIQGLLEQARQWDEAYWLCPLSRSLIPPGGPLLRTLWGHEGEVTTVAVTPDGNYAISGSADTTVRVWNLDTGIQRLVLPGHMRLVTDVAVTPHGGRIVSSSLDQAIRVWNLENGEKEMELRGHTDDITAIAITPDGLKIVSASADTTLKVWSLETGEALKTLRGHTSAVTAVAISPDGRKIISSSLDRMIIVWDLESGEKKYTLNAQRAREKGVWLLFLSVELNKVAADCSSTTAVAISPDGQQAISSTLDRALKVWVLKDRSERCTLNGHTKEVTAIAVTPDGKQVVSASADTTIKAWDLEQGKALKTLHGHTQAVNAVTVMPSGRRIISGSSDRTLKIWDLERKEAALPGGHAAKVTALAVTFNGRRLISGSDDETVKIWHVERRAELLTLSGHSGPITAVAATPDGTLVVSASSDGTLKLWDIVEAKELRTLSGHKSPVTAIGITADGQKIVSASDDKTLKIWDAMTGKLAKELPVPAEPVKALAITAATLDGAIVIYSSLSHTFKVWDANNKKEIAAFAGHSNAITAVAVTPDGQAFISASADYTLKVWDLRNRVALRTLTGHNGAVTAVAVPLDGRRVISASADQTIKLWDLANGAPLASFSGDCSFYACAVTQTGQMIFAGDEAGCMHFLSVKEPPPPPSRADQNWL